MNARDIAAERGIEIVESHSTRARNFANIVSVKIHTSAGERWLEGTVFEPDRPRLTFLDGVDIEATLEGTLLVLRNADTPGVIGQVGSILGRHSVNIASFALGRDEAGAVGVVDGRELKTRQGVTEIRARGCSANRKSVLIRADATHDARIGRVS